jgi:phospholipid N-methyltransferase
METNADFVRFLRGRVRDDRLHVVHGSAADADAALARLNLRQADYVISGIPYTTMPAHVRETILRKTHAVLHPTGACLVYQFTRTVLPYLQQVFALVHQDFEPLNVMPARLFFCRHHPDRANGDRNGQRTNGAVRPTSRQPVAPDPTPSATPPLTPG